MLAETEISCGSSQFSGVKVKVAVLNESCWPALPDSMNSSIKIVTSDDGRLHPPQKNVPFLSGPPLAY